MDELRRPFLIAALVVMAIVVVVEVGVGPRIRPNIPVNAVDQAIGEARGVGVELDQDDVDDARADLDRINGTNDLPGLGIPYMGMVDILLLVSVLVMAASLVIPERITGRLQGVAFLILSIVLIIGGIIAVIFAFVKLMIMIALFTSPPFGTLAYLALFGFFDKSGALAGLSVLMFLKLAFCVCLVLAQQRFIQNKGLVLLILTSLILNLVVAFLHGIVPFVLVSITDAIAAIIAGIVGIIWAIVTLVLAIYAIIQSIDTTDSRTSSAA